MDHASRLLLPLLQLTYKPILIVKYNYFILYGLKWGGGEGGRRDELTGKGLLAALKRSSFSFLFSFICIR